MAPFLLLLLFILLVYFRNNVLCRRVLFFVSCDLTDILYVLQYLLFPLRCQFKIELNFLKAVAKLESDFDPNCVSSAGAVGIMQMMPSTAEGLGVEDIYDPYQNIMAGAKYLRQMLDRFNGDYELAYAGYNAGPNAVARAGGIPQNGETPKAVALVMKHYNNGVTVPERYYTVNAGSSSEVSASSAEARAKVASELAEKLKEFPNHTSYDFFVQEMQKGTNNGTANAYENLLSQANLIIRQMIDNNK